MFTCFMFQEHELHSVEIQYGILQLSEALDFLHSDAKMLHGNVSPESVAVASSGAWKLMGFNFSSFSQYQSEAQVGKYTHAHVWSVY